MDRRQFLETCAAVPAFLRGAAGDRPNILLLMTDQHRGDCIGAAGNRAIHTPNLDRLAQGGAQRSGQLFGSEAAKDDISALPAEVRASFGLWLFELQQGETPADVKKLPQFGRGVFELHESFEGNAYRLMYVVSLPKAIYVLHVFMKKSKSGIGLPKPDAGLIEARLRRARALDAEG